MARTARPARTPRSAAPPRQRTSCRCDLPAVAGVRGHPPGVSPRPTPCRRSVPGTAPTSFPKPSPIARDHAEFAMSAPTARAGLSSSSANSPMILLPNGNRAKRSAARLPCTGSPTARCVPAVAVSRGSAAGRRKPFSNTPESPGRPSCAPPSAGCRREFRARNAPAFGR